MRRVPSVGAVRPWPFGLRCSAALPLLARENLLQEAKAETMDAILMLGDHAYNWAMGDERRVRRHDIADIWVAFFSS